MKLSFVMLAALALVPCVLDLHSALGEPGSDVHLGAPEMCLSTTRIKETIIIDDQTILFVMSGEHLFINRLPFRCPGLKIGNGFSYSTSIPKICKQDVISALWPDFVSGSRRGLGDFRSFKYDGDAREAIKRLKGGLLDKLVEEGAFKSPPPIN